MSSDRPLYADGYWKAPRSLRRLLEDGAVTTTEYALLNYLAHAGADRPNGVSTNYAALAGTTRLTTKTVKRALLNLRSRELVEYALGQGQRRPFRVTLGAQLRTSPTEVVSEVVSEVEGQLAEVMSEVAHVNHAGLRSGGDEVGSHPPKPKPKNQERRARTGGSAGTAPHYRDLDAEDDSW